MITVSALTTYYQFLRFVCSLSQIPMHEILLDFSIITNVFLIKVIVVISLTIRKKKNATIYLHGPTFLYFCLLIWRKVFLSFVLSKIDFDKVLFINVVPCNVTISNTSLWVFFTFFKFYKWYQIAWCISNGEWFFFQIPLFPLTLLQKETKVLEVSSQLLSTSVKRYFRKAPWKYHCKTILIVMLY